MALEKMERDGIERPREQPFGAESLAAIAEARSRAEAKIAELQILHRKELATLRDPSQIQQEEQQYQAERARIEDRRERRIEEIRQTAEKQRSQT